MFRTSSRVDGISTLRVLSQLKCTKKYYGFLKKNMAQSTVQAHLLIKAPAAERNKQPILDVLRANIPDNGPMEALEISSGTGQHVVHFASHFLNITWQPSEYDSRSLRIIEDHIKYSELKNVRAPLYLDASLPLEQWADGRFKPRSIDLVYCANLTHISPWPVTEGMVRGAGELLKKSGLLVIYGPFALDGVLQPQSNVDFDRSLRTRNKEWGVRDSRDVVKVAEAGGLALQKCIDMPANNKTLIFQKQ